MSHASGAAARHRHPRERLRRPPRVAAYGADEATFYFSDGLLRQPRDVIDAIVARQVAHEVLGHTGQRRTLSWLLTAGFTVLGFVAPGAGLLDFAVSPLIVPAFNRDQVIAADRRTVDERLAALGPVEARRP